MNRVSRYRRVSANTDAKRTPCVATPYALPPQLYNWCNIQPSRKLAAGVAPDQVQEGATRIQWTEDIN
jgi:hypothetical protein